MTSGGQQFILKFFSGPHAGPGCCCRPATTPWAATKGCDIVIHDDAVALRHARIRITAAGIEPAPMEQAVSVSGQAVTNEAALSFRQIAALGTTHFGIAPASEPWGAVVLPELGAASTPPTHAEPAPQSPPVATTGTSLRAAGMRLGQHSRQLLSVAGVCLFFCGLLVVFLYGNSQPTAASIAEPAAAQSAVESQIQALLDELGSAQLQLNRSAQRRLPARRLRRPARRGAS
ncbi:MAG: hypothetical protein U1F68_00300 [Gammaproteobacteria bacterium]